MIKMKQDSDSERLAVQTPAQNVSVVELKQTPVVNTSQVQVPVAMPIPIAVQVVAAPAPVNVTVAVQAPPALNVTAPALA